MGPAASSIRLACLSNPNALAVLNSEELADGASGKGELYRVLTKGDDDQTASLLKNPDSRFLLCSLYARENLVADIDEVMWRRLVQFSWSNPALNWDRTSSSGPDLDAWNLQAALRKFLTIAPATPDWVIPVHQVFLELDPSRTGTYQSTEEVLAVLERWKAIAVKDSFGDKDQTGFFTPLPMAEELRGLIAALYGKVLINKKLVPVGKPDSEDVALRCAWYGNTSDMSEEEMDAAREKDGTILTFAALFNDLLLLKLPRRAEIEMGLTHGLSFIHTKRCAQLKEHYHAFDPRPADELLAEAEADKSPQGQRDPLAPLMTELAEQRALIAGLKRIVIWGLIVIIAAVVFSHR
ncbi:hypothetical protein [Paraburkholderia sp. BR14374]|uniref:hypothetical protein n=1 Tax=Paraburkholderia sp. BR14374 TaxID=3237007 RepID=UPI0034CF4EC5